ncbi:MAG TPA: DUF4350 domain-containing protein [Gammaproteobacteria bacterium]
MQVSRNSRLNLRIQHLVFILLFTSCIGVAGWLSIKYDIRSDWTKGARHSLSEQSLQLLEQLPGEIELRHYQSNDPQLNRAVEEILSRYRQHKENFHYQLINADIHIEQARKDAIERYGQSIIEYQGRQERIDKLNEQNLSNALLRLQRDNKPRLLFISNHGERSPADTSNRGYSQLAQRLTQQGFVIEQVNLLQDELATPNLQTNNSLLVLGTLQQPLLETEQQKLLDYIQSGGNLLWLQDPDPDMDTNPSQAPLSDALQVEFIDGVVVDNNREIHRMLQLEHAAIIPILEYRLHPITEKMQYYTLFTLASALRSTAEPANKQGENESAENPWLATELLITSNNSWAEQGDYTQQAEFDPLADIRGPLSIGLAQQRQLTLNDRSVAQRAVIIGDSDFLSNQQLGHGANLDFILKSLNWLTQNEQLLHISPKNAPDLKLNLSATSASILGIFFLIGLPLLLLSSGALIWYRRRRA